MNRTFFYWKIQYLVLRFPLNPYQYLQRLIFYGPLDLDMQNVPNQDGFKKVVCMDKKHQKCPKNWVFPHLWPQIFFFKNLALSLLYTYGALTSCKKLEKNNERSPRYLKTDGQTHTHTHGQGWLLRAPSGNYACHKASAFCTGQRKK